MNLNELLEKAQKPPAQKEPTLAQYRELMQTLRQSNDQLQQEAKKYKNFKVIDWYGHSASHPDWFYGDKTHPNDLGQNYYSAYVVKHICENG